MGMSEDTTRVEAVAALVHKQLSEWTFWVLDTVVLGKMSQHRLEYWRRMSETPYSDLDEEEKGRYREWAREFIACTLGSGKEI